ncbi:MAG TPA: Calx-beta domain-containing protein [Cyclobacteriaceae bacterium]|nr:Calx-beta domain-containing protein [Cyclobacteriaceae bacterium]
MNPKPLAATRCLQVITGLLMLCLMFVLPSCDEEEPDPPTMIGFGSASQEVTEGNEINITVVFDKPTVEEGTVLVTLGGTAKYTSDYNTNPSGNTGSFTLPLAPGQSSATFSMATVQDDIYAQPRTVTFTLGAPVPAESFVLTETATFEVTINDDESPAIANFAIASATIAENSTSGYTVSIPFSTPARGEGGLTVSFASNTATADNFSTIPALNANNVLLTVPSAATGTSFTVLAKDDSYFHSDFVIVFEITATTGSVKAGPSKKFTMTIQENEVPSLANFDASSSQIAETGPPVTVLIPLSIPASNTGSVTISYASTNAVYGTDFTSLPAPAGANIVVPVAKDATQVQFTITPVDDVIDNAHQVITFTLTAADGVVRLGSGTVYILTITDNEPSLRKVLVSFGGVNGSTMFGNEQWNYAYSDTPNAGTTWGNLVRSDGVVTNLAIVVTSPLTAQPLGKTTGLNSGAFPDNALREYWYVPGPDQGITRGFEIRQANNAINYQIRVIGSTTVVHPDGKNTMTVAVKGVSKSINDVTNNVSEVLIWTDVTSAASIIPVALTDSATGGICPINALEITWYEAD